MEGKIHLYPGDRTSMEQQTVFTGMTSSNLEEQMACRTSHSVFRGSGEGPPFIMVSLSSSEIIM
jgi:hypothetical protein